MIEHNTNLEQMVKIVLRASIREKDGLLPKDEKELVSYILSAVKDDIAHFMEKQIAGVRKRCDEVVTKLEKLSSGVVDICAQAEEIMEEKHESGNAERISSRRSHHRKHTNGKFRPTKYKKTMAERNKVNHEQHYSHEQKRFEGRMQGPSAGTGAPSTPGSRRASAA